MITVTMNASTPASRESPPVPAESEPQPPSHRDRISRLEWGVAAAVAIVLVALVIAEPDVLEAPFASSRALLFTVGGTVLAAVALVVMLRLRVPPLIRILVLGIPFVITSWWLVSPYFRDEVVDDQFETSIAEAAVTSTTAPAAAPPTASSEPTATEAPAPSSAPESTAPSGPRLLGAGSFVGLAGHEGTGDAGFFELPDGSQVLRLERFDIENGPDLRLYVVPGADQVTPGGGAVDLGQLRGNVGDQTYELPDDLSLEGGDWTVLVWCEAFSVEFVAATVPVAG
jgi:hypothetical protein